MTHSGGKPRSQRYEVRATEYPSGGTSVIGWTDDLDGADKVAAAIRLAPGCVSTEIFDRQENRPVIKRYAGILR
jgi:hypothetical protein